MSPAQPDLATLPARHAEPQARFILTRVPDEQLGHKSRQARPKGKVQTTLDLGARMSARCGFGSARPPELNLVVQWPGNAGGDGFGWSSHQRWLPLL